MIRNALFLLLYAIPTFAASREVTAPLPADAAAAVRHGSGDIACGADQCLIAWTAMNAGDGGAYRIRGARVSLTGQLLDKTSFEIAHVTVLNSTPAQVIAVPAGYIVFYAGISYARVSRDGVVMARDQTTSVSAYIASAVKVVSNGTTVLMYSTENHGPLIPYVTLFDADLNVLRELKIDGQPTDLAVSGSDYVVASTSVDGLKVTRVASDGAILGTSVVPVWNVSATIGAANDGVLLVWTRPQSNAGPATTEYAAIANDGTTHLGTLDKSLSSSLSIDIASVGNGFLVLWSRPESGYYTNHLYARRISAAGELLDANPVQVSSIAPYQVQGKCAAIGGGYLAIWTDWRYGDNNGNVFAAPISATTEVGPDFLVSRLFISQSNAVIATIGDVVGSAWREAAGEEPGAILFERFHADGSGPIDQAPTRFSNAGANPAIATHAGLFIVAWREFNNARVAIIDAASGVVIAVAGGISMPGIGDISVAAGDTDILIICDNNGTILAAHVRYNGTVVDPIPRGIESGSDPRIAFDGSSYWVVSRNAGSIEARRLGPHDTFIDVVPFTIAAAADGTHDQPVISCGGGSCLALWRSIRTGELTIDGAILGSSGAVPNVIAARGDVSQPALAWNGDEYVVTFTEHADIHESRVSATGNVAGYPEIVVATNQDETSPAVSVDGSTRVYAFSRGFASTGDRLILAFEQDGEPRRRAVRH